jgi:hypothetical protein
MASGGATTTPPTPTQLGTEKRPQILPTADPAGPGFLGPKYDPSDFIPLPGDVGVRRGDNLSDVTNAVKGVAYYADVIGFGESSNGLTRGMNFQHFGVNYFMKTGSKCSNGADMWMYIETIPKGDALGKRVQKGLASAGLPAMRGLAPGMLEDVGSALDPRPVIGALFNGAYPSCRKVTLPVGDETGRVSDPESGALWVEGPVEIRNGKPFQTKWIQDKPISREEWENEAKTMKPDGTPIVPPKNIEGFGNGLTGVELATALLLGAAAVLAFRFRR